MQWRGLKQSGSTVPTTLSWEGGGKSSPIDGLQGGIGLMGLGDTKHTVKQEVLLLQEPRRGRGGIVLS